MRNKSYSTNFNLIQLFKDP